MTILVTGGAGFIGSNFILNFLKYFDEPVVCIDKLTYAGNLDNLYEIENNNKYFFYHVGIEDSAKIDSILLDHSPRAIVNFAAESHVDRSINGPGVFIDTNVFGTFKLLESSLNYWKNLNKIEKDTFRFVHISTDEVFGSLDLNDPPFHENSNYRPNSPYSASKAASDHLVRVWFKTYNLPVLITNCSNNFGPYQFPEKFIPQTIFNAISGKKIPIYGNGMQIRDWLYVLDHCKAILSVLEKGSIGTTYNIGSNNEKTNLEIAQIVCKVLDKIYSKNELDSYSSQIEFVADRPGHDRRYAINSEKIKNELGWKPEESFESGLYKTIDWYLSNIPWLEKILARSC
jgi:dTDP-glucose 4,6-dehydratase